MHEKSGVISVNDWTMAHDGQEYRYFFCNRWRIVTDKETMIEGFRSSEKWQLHALSEDGVLLAVFPGCQVKAFVFCRSALDRKTICDLGS